MKTKMNNNADLIKEDERKKNLEDKKLKLRSEILKQIEVDKQNKTLEEDLKKLDERIKDYNFDKINKENFLEYPNKDNFQNEKSIVKNLSSLIFEKLEKSSN